MKSISSLALRLFRANKFIVFTSIISISIAVSLVITLAVFSANAKQTLQDEMKALYGEFDLAVVYDDANPIQNEKALYDLIVNHPDTDAMTEVLVTQTYVNPLGGKIYTVGMENDALAQSRYNTTKNLEYDSVILTAGLAEALKLSVGDNVEIESRTFSLIEVIEGPKGAGIVPDMVIFALDTAKSFNDEHNTFSKFETTALMIKAKPYTDVVSMAVDLKKFNEGLRVDVMEQEEFVEKNMSSLAVFITVMSVLILIVTALMVISNFELFMYKNRNQFAIMRSMGAKTKQIAKITFIQSMIINMTGTALGLLIAAVGNKSIQPTFEKLFSFTIRTETFNVTVAMVAVLVSAVIIQIFLIIPVFKSSRMLPLMIMRENEKNDFVHQKLRFKVGFILLGLAIFVILFGVLLAEGEGGRALSILLGAVILLSSLFTLFPIYIVPILMSILPAIRKIFGKDAFIAVQSFIPQVRKNTFVILSISILMVITVFGSVLMTTVQHNSVTYINSQFPTSIVMNSRIYETEIDSVKLSAEIESELPNVRVGAVSNQYGAELLLNEKQVSFVYALGDINSFEQMGLLPKIEGKLGEVVIISPKFAKRQNLIVGDTFDVGMYSFEKQGVEHIAKMTIDYISNTIVDTDVLFDWQVQGLGNEFVPVYKFFIQAEDEQGTLSVLEAFKSHYPELQMNTHSKSLAEAKEMFLQRWSIFIVVLVALVLSVMAGVINTLVNNIYSKRKEFAVLRTVGVRPNGIVKIIVTQIVMYVLLGLLFGIVCGILFSYVISLIDPGGYAVDWKVIMSVVLFMLVISLLLFIPIGRKIGRQNITVEVLHDNK